MSEDSWVRSVYLYVLCAASVALVLVGLTTAAVGLVHTAVPDLGHRDAIDRVGIGLSNIGSDVVDLFNESQLGSVEEYCEEVTIDEADFDDCIADEQSFAEDTFGSIEQGIGEVKDELNSQIRNSSIDALLRGLLMALAGVVLFRIHAPRTELFANGLLPQKPSSPPAEPVEWEAPPE